MIDFDSENELRPCLVAGERLVWTGRPKTGILLRPSDKFMIPFSIMWGGFALVWEASVIIMDAPILFMLWGIPFVLVGLYLMIGRFFVDVSKRKRTFYGLTEDRIIIKSGQGGSGTKSFTIKNLTEIEFSEKKDGSGTIMFGPAGQTEEPRTSKSINFNGMNRGNGFEFIEDVKSVYEIILGLQRRK